MADIQAFETLALPKLPGSSGLPVQSVQRFALRDKSGVLLGYTENTTLQNWSALGLLIGNVTFWGVDLSKKIEITTTYDANGKLVGGSMWSNGKAYSITSNAEIYTQDKPITPTLPDYGAFPGSDQLGAAAKGADRAAKEAGRVLISETAGLIDKQLDKAAMGNAALSADTRGVIIEGAGIVGTGAGAAAGWGGL
jgi:hypothetical protein